MRKREHTTNNEIETNTEEIRIQERTRREKKVDWMMLKRVKVYT